MFQTPCRLHPENSFLSPTLRKHFLEHSRHDVQNIATRRIKSSCRPHPENCFISPRLRRVFGAQPTQRSKHCNAMFRTPCRLRPKTLFSVQDWENSFQGTVDTTFETSQTRRITSSCRLRLENSFLSPRLRKEFLERSGHDTHNTHTQGLTQEAQELTHNNSQENTRKHIV